MLRFWPIHGRREKTMANSVKISVDDGASHSVRVTRTATTTGQEYEGRDVKAGEEASFELNEEERISIGRGAATEAPAEEASTTAKKKS